VGTRGSRLALTQTESVVSKLKLLRPSLEISIETIATAGDRDRLTQLDQMGTDVFVKELRVALADGRIDLAVHSLKDVPTDTPDGLALIAVVEREDPRDVLVAPAPLADLLPGSRIGTGSLRRSIQLAEIRPDLEIHSIRGNVDTRLRKVDSGAIGGVILAAAGLNRLGWHGRITEYLPIESFLPAAGQGALAVEARAEDQELIDAVSPLHHLPTAQCVTAERTFLRELGGGCRAPIAALGTIHAKMFRLDGMVAGPSGKKVLRDSIQGDVAAAGELGMALAGKMLGMGASELIAEAKHSEIR
jgi:hydroxymethylbilane synthase